MFQQYFTSFFDTAHFFELLLLGASWSLIENRPWENTRSLARFLLELFVLFLAFLLCDIILNYRFRSQFLLYWVLAQALVSATYVFLHSEECSRAGLALWCSMCAGAISLTAIGGQVSIILASLGVPGSWQGFSRVVFCAMSIPLAMYLKAKRLDEYENVPLSGLVMILAGDFCLFVIRFLESRFFSIYISYAVILAAAYFCVLILVLCAVYAVDSICREQTRSIQLLAQKQRAISERELVTLTEKQLDDLRELRHDIKNQFSYMRILLADRRYEELDAYFQRQDIELAARTATLNCGNRCVSIVLNMELQKAEAAGVGLHTKLVVPPVLPFPDDDLCSLLSNLIDNAIDECVRMGVYFPKLREQGVSVSINPGNPSSDYLYIEVQNPTDRKHLTRRRDGLVSTKSDDALHGYGTRIITRIAEKYNGSALFEAANGVFTARVILDMMIENKEETT